MDVAYFRSVINAVREFANKSAASPASPDYVKIQAVIKSAASAASLAEAALAADWITAFFSQFLAALAAKKYQKIVKISDSVRRKFSMPEHMPLVCLLRAQSMWTEPA